MTVVKRVDGPKFSASVVDDYHMVAVSLVGSADLSVRADVAEVATAAHELAVKSGYARVQVDIRELVFMTSSCLKELIAWLDQARASGVYQITFLSSGALSWQRRSLHALSHFAQDLVTVQIC